MATANLVIFSVGDWAAFQQISPKDINTLYFIQDKGLLYKGDKPYGGGGYEEVTAFPEDPAQGKLYIHKTTGETKYWDGSKWKVLIKQYSTKIAGSGDDVTVPTTKAVADFVDGKIADVVGGNGVFVTNITPKPNGVLNIAKGTENNDVTFTGIVTDPTYDASTRTITMPIAGKSALTIALGKDLAVRAGKYNTETKEIWLTLAEDGSYSDLDKVVKIPSGDLVDVYTGGKTNSTSTTVTKNEITVDVNVSKKAGNKIQVVGGVGEEGLYVPETDLSGKLDLVSKSKTNEIVVAQANGQVTASGKKIGGIALNAAPDGNTVATEKATKDYADKVSGAAKTNAVSDSKKYVDGLLQWKSF